ncbi:hypothetical protein HDU67_009183 [Dinochytrium kinnereticum]|nr:hypothetical protein HDU67_009183 [Dinochytrium kinnereticum]
MSWLKLATLLVLVQLPRFQALLITGYDGFSLNASRSSTQLFQFGTFAFLEEAGHNHPITKKAYLQGGEINLSAGNVFYRARAGENRTLSEAPNLTWMMVCREDDSFNFDDIILDGTVDTAICDKLAKAPSNLTQCPYVKTFRGIVQQDPQGFFSLNYPISQPGYYSTVAVLCAKNVSAHARTIRGSFTNPGPRFIRHLSAVEIPVLITYIVYIILWGIVNIVWFSKFISMRHMANLLYLRISSLPLLFFFYTILSVSYFLNLGIRGVKSEVLETLRFLFVIIHTLVLYAMLQLLSKGWYIVRKRLSPVEKRTIGGMALFVSLGNVFFQYIGNGAVAVNGKRHKLPGP